MSKNWTKGPWRRQPNSDKIESLSLAIGRGRVVDKLSIAFKGSEEFNANAHLIAAAPELYDALENLLNGIRSDLVKVDAIADETWANAMQKADAALAKARGES